MLHDLSLMVITWPLQPTSVLGVVLGSSTHLVLAISPDADDEPGRRRHIERDLVTRALDRRWSREEVERDEG